MLVEEVADFLGRTVPFQFAPRQELLGLAATAMMDYFPKGMPILTQGGPPSDSLHLILRGAAKVFLTAGDGSELVVDYRSPGDSLGFLSLFSGDRSRTNVVAEQDTLCYLLPREPFMRFLDAHPPVRDFFQSTFLSKYMDRAFGEMHSKSQLFAGGEKLLFTTTIGELAQHGVVSASPSASIREAAQVMSRHRISSLVLVDGEGAPAGIITDRDLRVKVAASGRDTGEPVSGIMSTGLVTSEPDERCFEGLLKMIRHHIHHLLVVDGGKLRGIVTNHDLMLLQGTSPISVVKEIEGQQDLAGLAEVSRKVNAIIGLLLKEGARASNVTRIITEINDRLQRNVLEAVAQEVGPAPLPCCWIVFGSEGRKEQTFRTDQDNAIVFADAASPAEEQEMRAWCAAFASRARDGLVACGFPACPADFMASNPSWAQPLETWKALFSRWIGQPSPESLLRSLIFFDFRPLHGRRELAEELRAHLARTLRRQNVFFARMAGMLLRQRPPLGLFGAIVVDKEGAHKDQLNLKIHGLGPIVDLARLFALEAGVPHTSTLERLAAVQGRHPIATEFGGELAHAFEFLTLLRLHRQYSQLQEGREIDNFLNPEQLSTLERKSLRDAFRLVYRVQDLVAEHHGATLVRG